MPDAVFAILGALVRLERESRAWEIADVAGYSINYFARIKFVLFDRGWIERPFAMSYRITERGKIALAIETGRRTKRRGCRSPQFKSFQPSA